MTRDEIDRLWQKALHDAILAGEQYTRYHFANLVAAEQQQRIEQLEADTQEVAAGRIYLREKAALLQEMARLNNENTDLAALCMTTEQQLAASQAQIKVLREALEGVLPWVVTQTVACSGLKCRERVCISCNGEDEAENSAQEACEKSQSARNAISTPQDDSALQAAIAAEREACAVVCEKSDRYRGDYFAAKIRARGDSK